MDYAHSDIMSDRSFRILQVHGSDEHDSPIHCDLIERSLDAETPTYEAISYCWGGQKPTQTIICADRRLRVTRNCESALRRFRPAPQSQIRLLWVDSICINQSNMPERSNQVRLMGEIYKGASRVLVWLENDNETVTTAAHLDRNFHLSNFSWLIRLGEATLAQSSDQKEAQLTEVADELNNGGNVSTASMHETLVRLPWFKRLWIVQEVVLSRQATLVYGGREASLDTMLEARKSLSSLQKRGYRQVASAAGIFWNLFAVHLYGRTLLQSTPPGQLPHLNTLHAFMDEVRYSMATDPRDKVLGLYGFLTESGLNLPSPDYSKSAATIFRETMVALTEATNSLRLIHQVDGLGSLPDRTSWVPDWSSSKHSIGPSAGPCLAAGNSNPMFRFLNDSTTLAMMGIRVDRVVRCSSHAYMHIGERLGEAADYAKWTKNPPIRDDEWAARLKSQPEYSTAILFLWNIRVLRDFVNIALDGPPATASRQSILALYYSLLSQRGGHESQELGLQDSTVGEHRARDFFSLLFDEIDGEGQLETDDRWILGHDFALQELEAPHLRDLLDSSEFRTLQRISRKPVRKLIFDAISRIRYMTTFTTEHGRTGIAPWSVNSGDGLALCSGLGLPVVMRPVGSRFNLVCCAYVHGIMHGEAWSQGPHLGLSELEFV